MRDISFTTLLKQAVPTFGLFALLIPLLTSSCNNTSYEKEEINLGRDEKITHIVPEKPVKIKVKRNREGEYSWELYGDKAEKIVEINKTLESGLLKSKESEIPEHTATK